MAEKAKLSSKDRLLLVVVCIGAFMGILDVSIVNIAIPTISKTWDVSTSIAMWVIFAYSLSFCALLPTFGKLGDRLGFKKLYFAGFLIFACGSLLSGLSNDINSLILYRFIQGAGSAMMGALAFAAVMRYIPPHSIGKGLGLVATASALGAAIGPVVGGAITEFANFHWIFLINVPIGIVGALLAVRFMPNDCCPARKKFDLPGAGLIFLTLFCVIYGLNLGQELGWTSPSIVGALIAAVVFFILFLFAEKRATDPLIPVSLIAQKEILRPVIATALIMASFGGAFVLLPYYLEYVVGLSTGSAGALLMAASVTMLFSGLWGGTASDKGSLRKLGLLAAGIALLAYVLMSTFGVGTAMVVVILALILLGWGTGSFLPVNNRQVLARVPMDMQGVGSSTVGTIRVVGQTMGVAVMATVFQSFLVGHPNVGDVASGFAAAMLLGIVMVAIALLLVWFTTDPERKEGEKIPVL